MGLGQTILMNIRENEKPLVSVLMTAYNREKYIAQAIESVLQGGFENFELIIVDDGSKDRTKEIIEQYCRRDSRIKFFCNEKNLGDYPNRNKAASYASGKYIQSVDSDDMLLPGGLNFTVGQMEANSDVDFAILCKDPTGLKQTFEPQEAIKYHFFKKPFLQIGPGGTIMKKNFFDRIGKYPTSYGPANDNFFNLVAAAKGKIMLLNNDFIYYRIHEGQEINNQLSYLYNSYRYQADVLKDIDLGLDKSQIAWLEKKNKRRFLVNISKYFFRTRSIKKTTNIIRLAKFKASDILPAVFQKPGLPPVKFS